MDTPVLDCPVIDRTDDLNETLARITARFREIVDRSFVPSRPTVPATEMTDEQVNLLQQALDYITSNPLEHNQGIYGYRKPSGQVVGCVAFHVARIAGRVEFTADAGGIPGSAMNALGITQAQARELFAPDLSVSDLWTIAGRFSGGRITRPASV